MPVTQKDIAKKLNLSRSMVGLVLSNHPSARVSSDTRREILRIANEMGYSPNAAARTLRDGRTNVATVAVVVSKHDSTAASHMQWATMIALHLSKAGLRPSLCMVPTIEEMMPVLQDIVRSKGCDGVVLTGDEDDTEQMGLFLEKEGMPFVAKGYHENHPEWAQVEYDHRKMMEIAVRELWDRGHRRIGFATYDDPASFTHQLEAGFKQAIASMLNEPGPSKFVRRHISGDNTADEIFEEWFSLPEEKQPTAAVIASGTMAWRAAELALAKRNRRISFRSNDFAIVGLSTKRELLDDGEALAFHTSLNRDVPEQLSKLLIERLQTGRNSNVVTRILAPLLPVLQDPEAAYYATLFRAKNGAGKDYGNV